MTARPLLDELRRRASAAADAARAAAAEEVRRIREEAGAAAGRAAADARARARAEVEHDLARARGLAGQESRARTLPARAVALDRIFARARECTEARATHPGLPAAAQSLVTAALAYVPEGATRVRCAPPVVESAIAAMQAAGRDAATVTADPSVPLGAIVESADGRVSVNATFARRLELDRASLAAALSGALDGGEP